MAQEKRRTEQRNDKYEIQMTYHQLFILFELKIESLTVSKLQMEFYRQ